MNPTTLAKHFPELVGALLRAPGADENYDSAMAVTMARAAGAPAIVVQACQAKPFAQRELLGPSAVSKRHELVNYLAKAAVDAMLTSDPNVSPVIAFHLLTSAFLASLRNASLTDAILAGGALNVPANVRVAVTAAIAAGDATAVEGDWLAVSKFSFAGLDTAPLYASVLTVLSNDLIRMGGGYAETVVTAALRAAIALKSDLATVPRLLAGVSPIASTGDARTDLAAAFAGISLGQLSRPLIATSPDVVKELALAGTASGPTWPDVSIPLGGSISACPLVGVDALSAANTGGLGDVLLVVDCSRCAGDPGVVTLDAAKSASIAMTDDTESPVARTVVNLFQDNAVAMRLNRYFVFERSDVSAVAVVRDVDYSVGSP